METKGRFRFQHSYVYLLSAPVLLSLYYYHNSDTQFLHLFPALSNHVNIELYFQYWKFFLFFILAGLIPFLYVVLVVKKPLSYFGLGIGDYKLGLKLLAIIIPLVILPLIWIASHMPTIKAEYPLARSLITNSDLFWQYELIYIICYYIAWEFFFRGFILFGLAEKFGITHAILIQTISSCLIHLGKPEGETLGSIVSGIIFGYIAIKTRSIWYVWIMHFTIGVLTDYFVLKQLGVRI